MTELIRKTNTESLVKINEVPVIELGPWSQYDVVIDLAWGNGRRWQAISDPDTRSVIHQKYLELTRLSAHPLSPEGRKKARVKIRPFPGLVAATPIFDTTDGKLNISCNLSNFQEVATLNNPKFLGEFPDQKKEIFEMARGLGIGIIVETADGLHIFGVRGGDVIGARKISILGATPNISPEEMAQFVSLFGNPDALSKQVKLPGSWLFNLVKEDIVEPEELNTTVDQIDNLSLIGVCDNLDLNWTMLAFYCKLKLTKEDIERGFLEKGAEHTRMIFVPKNINTILEFISNEPNISSGSLGVYHTYLESLKKGTQLT